MRNISSFGLQYGDVDYSQVSASSYDLFITEGNPLDSTGIQAAFTTSQLSALEAQGRTVVGYVDVSVVADNRYYWQANWTSNHFQTGTLTADAPSWLKDGAPIKDGNGDITGYIADFSDPAWQHIVLQQADWLVDHGYNGVFLDDIEQYFELAKTAGEPDTQTLARDMINFVSEIDHSIKKINPDAYVVVNGDPYILGDANSATESSKFLGSFDKMLMENYGTTDYDNAKTDIGASRLLALYSQDSTSAKLSEAQHAEADHIAAYDAPDQNYDSLGAFVNPGTSGNDVLNGGDGPNQISGDAGNDTIDGGGGNDKLSGSAGNDVLTGDDGNDALFGSGGIDTLTGGAGADRFIYHAVSDSTGTQFDTITDFDADSDDLDFQVAITGVDAEVTHGTLSAATFAPNLRADIGAAQLAAHHAVLFMPDAGDYAGQLFLVVDINGVAGYQPKEDMIIRLQGSQHMGDFGTGAFS